MTGPDAPPSDPGANPLDTPEVREAVVHALAVVLKPWVDKMPDPDEAAIGTVAVLDAVFAALAPHVASAQRAAFRAGVEAAAGVCRYVAEANGRYAIGEDGEVRVQFESAAEAARDCVEGIAALPVPAAFAAPEQDGWYDIATAPRDGTSFLAALSNGNGALLWAPFGLQRARPRYLWWRGTAFPTVPVADTHPPGTPFEVVATHWHPCPAMPVAGARQGALEEAEAPGEPVIPGAAP